MKRFVNIFAWALLIKILIGSICLLGWDMYQTKMMLNAVEIQRDNAVRLNEIVMRQIEECKHVHSR